MNLSNGLSDGSWISIGPDDVTPLLLARSLHVWLSGEQYPEGLSGDAVGFEK